MGLVDNNVVDLDLSVTRKKRFRIDGDDNRILELNISDTGIISRLNELYPKLTDLANSASDKLSLPETEEVTEEMLTVTSDAVKEIDETMRKVLDELFESNVSEICAPNGTMLDLFNGKFRFEHIIDTLSALYENNFREEYKKVSQRIQRHTDKYTGRKKKK